MSADGTKMYFCGTTSRTIYQYTLTTAWDLSTASYASKNKSISFFNVDEFHFRPDGTSVYCEGTDTLDAKEKVRQYDLGTAWDISTAVYDGSPPKDAITDNEIVSGGGLYFKTDGTKMYVHDTSGDNIYQYGLSVAWDVTSASYDSVSSGSVEALFFGEISLGSFTMSSDGLKAYFIDNSQDQLLQANLTTAWDITTLEEAPDDTLSMLSEGGSFSGAGWDADGLEVYIANGGGGIAAVYQYSLANT